MVIHPKELPEKTLFAIDQFVMRGGRTIVCVDPHCFSDQPPPQTQMTGRTMSQNSNLNRLLAKWGVETAENTFAGDKALALTIPSPRPTERPAPLIGFLNLAPPDCYTDHVISADLNQVRMLFSGVLEKVEPVSPPEEKKDPAEDAAAPAPPAYRIQPLLQTTAAGNSFKIDNPFELNPRMMSAQSLLRHFHEGKQPVMMACLISGRLESNFPEGITVRKDASADDKPDDPGTDDEDKKEKEPEKTYKDEPLEDSDDPNMVRRTGLTAADDKTECAVAVFADVDFITDQIAYQQTFFGAAVAGDNSALLLNTIEHFSGSGDLIAIRSRGNFRRPFTRVEKIEKEAEKETADQEAQIQAEIKNYEDELKKIVDEHKSKG